MNPDISENLRAWAHEMGIHPVKLSLFRAATEIDQLKEQNAELLAALKAIIAALSQPAHMMSLTQYELARAVRIAQSREGDVTFAIETAAHAIAKATQQEIDAK